MKEEKNENKHKEEENEEKTKKAEVRYSDKSGMMLLLYCFFCGIAGLHRFYVGKKITGMIYLCSLGIFGVGIIYDLLLILKGRFTDKKGRIVQTTANWEIKK